MTQWSWEYRPGEVVEKRTPAGVFYEPQPAVPRWSWLGGTPTPRAQVLGARRARSER